MLRQRQPHSESQPHPLACSSSTSLWWCRLLLIVVCLVHSGGLPLAQERPKSGESAPDVAISDQGLPFGVVYRVSGEVRAVRGQDQNGRPLRQGDVTYVGELIRTGPEGEAVLKTDDAGMIGIRSNTEFLAERFSAKAQDSDRMTLRLIQGSLRVISGWIGRLHRENYAIRTPAATIGVRGTDHEPYVLSPSRASGTPYQAGSYDKVNSGRTVITTPRGELEVDAGRVGFARGTGPGGGQTRGLLTLLLPVLLDKIPDFYLGGRFESDLDAYSKAAEAQSTEKMQQQQNGTGTNPTPPAGGSSGPPAIAACNPRLVAKEWIARFDKSIMDQDAAAVASLFSEDATVDAIVHGKGGDITSLTLSRQEFASSSAGALRDLKNYSQHRSTMDATELSGNAEGTCPRVYIKSEVIEQGRQNGRPYRFESREEFVLEQQDGVWRATHAVATQR